LLSAGCPAQAVAETLAGLLHRQCFHVLKILGRAPRNKPLKPRLATRNGGDVGNGMKRMSRAE
jgi:hypothetical protein